MYTIKITTLEDGNPILDHVFYGANQEECEQYIEAHTKYDKFFAATLEERDFQGMKLSFEEEHTEA